MSRAPRIAASIPGTRHSITRRHALGMFLTATLIASHHSQDSLAGGKAGGAAIMVGDTYVGRTADPEVFVAVVFGAHHVTAYVCDGAHREVDRWFYGQLIGDEVDLTATDGTRFIGVQSSSGLGGWIVLRNGRSLRFLAHPATGTAGLYAVSVRVDGRIHGRSSTRAVLDGEPMRARFDEELLPSPDAPAAWQILGLLSPEAFTEGVTFTAQISLPDGHSVPVGVWLPSADPGRVWVILLADGGARGHGIAMASGTSSVGGRPGP